MARNVCRRISPMFWVSPLAALLCSGFGFMVANHADYPPAQMTVAFMGLLLVAAWSLRFIRRRLLGA